MSVHESRRNQSRDFWLLENFELAWARYAAMLTAMIPPRQALELLREARPRTRKALEARVRHYRRKDRWTHAVHARGIE
ncbi:MAG: hypothetical protein HKL99_10830 [Burkholderiales bacterium]|nr:hypothetical protein [Burkholderiales bacterium]